MFWCKPLVFHFLFPLMLGLFFFLYSLGLCIPNFKCFSKLPCTLEATNKSHEYIVSLTSFKLNPWTRYRSHVSAIFGRFQSNATQLCNDWWITSVPRVQELNIGNVSKTWPIGWSCIETTHQIPNPRYRGLVIFRSLFVFSSLYFFLSCSFFHLPSLHLSRFIRVLVCLASQGIYGSQLAEASSSTMHWPATYDSNCLRTLQFPNLPQAFFCISIHNGALQRSHHCHRPRRLSRSNRTGSIALQALQTRRWRDPVESRLRAEGLHGRGTGSRIRKSEADILGWTRSWVALYVLMISWSAHVADFHCWLDLPAGPSYYRPHTTYTEDTNTKYTASS